MTRLSRAHEEAQGKPLSSASRKAPTKTADAIAEWLALAGIRLAFGVSGGGIAHLWSALGSQSAVRLVHCQHESGAAFAATEASLASNAPVAVLTTTGPGLLNALTGLMAARSEGAKVLLLSSVTPASRRGRIATQETHHATPLGGLFEAGPLFDFAAIVESPAMLPAHLHRILDGFAGAGGFLAHLGLPTDVQDASASTPMKTKPVFRAKTTVSDSDLDRIVESLCSASPWIVVGFEARHAARKIAELLARTDALVCATPRGKGIIAENHPQYVGVLGFGGHDSVDHALAQMPPTDVLVLGSCFGEASSSWNDRIGQCQRLWIAHPKEDLAAGPFPQTETWIAQTDIETLVDRLLDRIPIDAAPHRRAIPRYRDPQRRLMAIKGALCVRPSLLMQIVQEVIVDASDSIVMADSGNSFAWAIHHLQLASPRLRVSVHWGSMAHFSTGCIGAALATGKKTVVLTGDGSMLMGHEISTAVRHRLPVVWIVLNDGGYNMCKQGMSAQGLKGAELSLSPTNFATLALSLGARSRRIEEETDLASALAWALQEDGPVVLDIVVDPRENAPISRRIQALTWHENVNTRGSE